MPPPDALLDLLGRPDVLGKRLRNDALAMTRQTLRHADAKTTQLICNFACAANVHPFESAYRWRGHDLRDINEIVDSRGRPQLLAPCTALATNLAIAQYMGRTRHPLTCVMSIPALRAPPA